MKLSLWKLPVLAGAALLAFIAVPRPAQAQLVLNLTPAGQAGNVPAVFHFTGTLSNPTASDVFVNNDSLSFNGPASSLDDSPFFNQTPFTLGAAGSGTDTYSGSFFNVAVPSTAATTTYFGTFSILGGSTASAMDTVATEDFSVTVTGHSSSPVPEASTTVSLGVMLLVGLGGVVVAARRRKAAASL